MYCWTKSGEQADMAITKVVWKIMYGKLNWGLNYQVENADHFNSMYGSVLGFMMVGFQVIDANI